MNKQILAILSEKGINATAMRLLVIEVFLQNSHALSLSDIENQLHWSDRVTIYRTLKTFEQNGVIHQINDGSASVKYALCESNCRTTKHFDLHPHFHCEQCGKTICLAKQEINIDTLPDNLQINNYSLIFNGLCSACKENKCEN